MKKTWSIKEQRWLLIGLVAVLAAGLYPAYTYARGLLGFPLDDAWIHQTYARNLAETGQLAYRPGQPSAGSTSPAWSFLLSVGYLLGLDYRLWAYLLGTVSLAATAWLVYRLVQRLGGGQAARLTAALFAGLLCAVEWHLVWAAVSGMETMLFTAFTLALLEYLFLHVQSREASEGPASLRAEQRITSAVGIGLLGGALTLTRPEGVGLVGLVLLAMLLLPRLPARGDLKSRLLAVGVALLGFGLLMVPYVLFNLSSSGSLFPNTLYAKQTEYQFDLSLPARFFRVLSPTLVGAQILLVPGFGYAVYRLFRRQQWLALLPFVWWIAFLAVYTLRLPVNYQHGRYTIPTIPILILYGVWGTSLLLRPQSPQLWVRVLSRALPVAVALVALYFWVVGAKAYHAEVGFVEGEMVATAHWLDEHTAPDDILAVHDIGAVGYFTDRNLLDLAGLITPEAIPFMRDADRLAAWMVEQGAEYAVFFADFSPTYVQMAADPRFEPVYCTDYLWTRQQGQQNMCTYRLTPDSE